MRFWLRYLYEKRYIAVMYFVTAFLFIAIGTLYHFENLEKLLYAWFLTLILWGAAGFLGGFKYVQKSRQLEDLTVHFEQSGELCLREYGEKALKVLEGEEDPADYDTALWLLLSHVLQKKEADRMQWEEKTAECRDYYIMWTHQIKTPISALRLLLENGDAYEKNVFLMKEELFKIEQYAKMALTFQRLENISSDLVLQEYDLYGMLKNAVRKYAVLFINKGLSLELQETDIRIVTDEKWFGICVEQLLSNSIKYTAAGKIFIRAEAVPAQQAGRSAVLSIEDTGIGIRPEDLPRIFERGFTGYNGRLDKRSTGIGLYICRKIFVHLGIAVHVESQEGRGTKVTLTLPCSPHLTKL